MARTIYLVCYDVAAPNRLAKVHKTVQAYAIGGQKSFYECWLTQDDLRGLREAIPEVHRTQSPSPARPA